jgi:hypothetical protein
MRSHLLIGGKRWPWQPTPPEGRYIFWKRMFGSYGHSRRYSKAHTEHTWYSRAGTSLSKGYGVIRRFSEDVDLTYDIRTIASDLLGNSGATLPRSKSQAKKWTDAIRARLPKLLSNKIAPLLTESLGSQGIAASVETDGDKIYLRYDPLASGYGYVAPAVTLEFGARATGEPNELRDVICDAASYLPTVDFPTARPSLTVC